MKPSNEFNNLVTDLKRFQIKQDIFSERELESEIESYLKSKNYSISRQKVIPKVRNDLVVEINSKKICLELKVNADISCTKQLDSYLGYFNDGIILVCWRSSKNLHQVFENVRKSIKIPVELIQIRRYQSIV